MVDFSTYQPPSIFVEDQTTPVVAPSVTTIPALPAICGPTRGYRIYTERVTLDGTDAVGLSKLGIDDSTIEVTSLSGDVYLLDTDYTVAQADGEDGVGGTSYDDTTTVARIDGQGISDGDEVYVSYRYTDSDFVAPQTFADRDSVVAMYGPAVDLATGEILSPLTLAAEIAFTNGAPAVVCVPTLGGDASTVTAAQLETAYAKLSTIPEVSVVVGLPVGITGTPGSPGDTSTVVNSLLQHVEASSLEGFYRIGIIGHERTVTVTPDGIAQANPSSRLLLAWPNRLDYFSGETNTNIEVSGYYLAAAYAGQITGNVPQEPLTKNRVRGFAGVPSSVAATMTTSLKNSYSSSGVAVTEPTRDKRLVVRHGLTTDVTSVLSREVSLTRARDAMVLGLETTFERSGIIGSPLTRDTPVNVKGIAAGVLESMKEQGIVLDYRNLLVRQVSVDPTVIEIKFEYRPAYPVNYIVLSFSVDVQSGEIALNDTVAL